MNSVLQENSCGSTLKPGQAAQSINGFSTKNHYRANGAFAQAIYSSKLSALFLLFAALLSISFSVNGQTGSFPVQVTVQALPPAPIYLSNYADASTLNSPLRVQLALNDFTIPSREVRIKTYFQGTALSFESNDLVVAAPTLVLEGGIPLTLTNTELAPYFEFQNITGVNANQYGAAIPEGAYQFCVDVFDALTGNRLSARSCAINVVFQNEPPFLVTPRNRVNVNEYNPQNIVFQWTPRSINVTNVEYELSLVEIWDTQVDPQQAFLSSPPIFQTTTTAKTYVYGPADPLLLSGKNYAWRVQAKAKQGTEEIGLFKNEGYSEIFSFSYDSSCDLPIGIAHEVKGSTNTNIFWEDFSTDIPEFTVRYRKTASPGQDSGSDGEYEWFLAKTTGNQLTLWNLTPNTTYEYQVQKKCAVTESEWSGSQQFTTLFTDDENSVYECGIDPDFSVDNQEPLPSMGIGETFAAGDFPVKIMEVSGSNGRYTGKGYVTIPYLESVRVAVTFTNVLINTDKQLIEGSVVTVYDPSLSNILDIDDAVDTFDDIVGSFGDLYDSLLDLLNDFQGTQEEIEALQNSNNEYEELLGDLLANPNLDDAIKNQLSEDFETYQNASNELIVNASQGGPNPDGYDTGGVTDALNNLNETTKNAEEGLDANSNLEITFNTDDLIEIGEVLDANIWYVSPAGVPVSPPKDAILSFYRIRNNPITAYGALAGFTITEGPEKGIYRGFRKANQFTGYKRSKDEEPYRFEENPNPDNALVRTIDDGLGCGAHLYFEGTITSANSNETGSGELVLSWNVNSSWSLLTIDEQTNNSTCLPKINYDDFKNYHLGFYNFYGNGGFLRQVSSNEDAQYIYTIANGENGRIQHYQFNSGNGLWQSTLEPTYDVRTAEALEYLFGQIFSSEAGHFLLDVAGMAPVAGEVFDVLNGTWYTLEGNTTDAAISFASTIPLVYLTTAKNVGKIIKLSDGSLSVVNFSERATTEFVETIKKLDLDADSFKLLEADMADEVFAKGIADNPKLVDAWKKLDDLGADEAIRRNPGALEVLDLKAKGQLDDIPDPSTYLDADYIANHLAKFDDGGSRIVLKETYVRRGLGKPDEGMTEFISTKLEIDYILTLPVAEQAERLGLLVDEINGGLVRIDFNPSNKIEIPSGKEFGANDKWIPGGKTSGGADEAIIKTEGMVLDVDYTVIDL